MFYSVIETRDFSLFNQSAQALLKGYFINADSHFDRLCSQPTVNLPKGDLSLLFTITT